MTGDGGLPTIASIVPKDTAELSSFLNEHQNAPGYRLTYAEDASPHTRLLWNASVVPVRSTQSEDYPVVQCTPLTPTEDEFIVEFTDITRISVVQPPAERYTTGARTLSEKATELYRLAETEPDAVRVPLLVALVDELFEGFSCGKQTVQAARRVAAVRPEDCRPIIPGLITRLTDDDSVATPEILRTLGHIGGANPGDIAPFVDEITPYLNATNVTARREAATCLTTIAKSQPRDVVAAMPTLITLVRDRAKSWEAAVKALVPLTADYPNNAGDVIEPLAAIALDESVPDRIRIKASAGLGNTLSNAVPVVSDIVELLQAECYELRSNVVELIDDIALTHPGAVHPHTEDVAALLIADNKRTRSFASSALTRVAADFPETVAPLTPMFVRLLTDDDSMTRASACQALGYVGATEAKAALRQLATADEDSVVRSRADWALTEIER